jgi:predicted GIY-YIG superfamily endonuclease|tara:strand:+ start:508 stop:1029 length:522 start_codon:yes stop_codon:yes gene_type:complete
MTSSFWSRKINEKKKSIFNKDGTMKNHILIEKEITKIEEERPKRYKRNGVEVENKKIKNAKEEIQELRKNNKNIKVHKLFNGKVGRTAKLNLKYFNTGCIYFLYNKGKLVYIGQTDMFARRLSQHISENKKKFDSFKIRYHIENVNVRENTEKRLIKKYHPKYNKIHNNNSSK